jgi:uridylate kinase
VIKLTAQVDGIYTQYGTENARLVTQISHEDVLKQRLKIMDLSAIAIADENNLPILIFNSCKIGDFIAGKQVGSVIGNTFYSST